MAGINRPPFSLSASYLVILRQVTILPLAATFFLGHVLLLLHGGEYVATAALEWPQLLGHHGKTLAQNVGVDALCAVFALVGVVEGNP
ncbi:hypothetical protein GMOD_00008735 [Pyrenophora seminiperda CCB06]|uniref:Uncharacterized protein n=1 Tax=Pyrenophora seminiperda CCB06 TaxID=1302712 RepID=A0A3M7M611_9PLEO|nr:hypothetical protein GMOD_00008735 [Pyrenophora seminiperda CCB06]